ncbi:MAG: cyclic nucleotide-binding domain-containing protein [Lentisphaeria bacterium]|nr:cyclic nucleotide-binding domain-containing protein [Lentisphaeria bacterium]
MSDDDDNVTYDEYHGEEVSIDLNSQDILEEFCSHGLVGYKYVEIHQIAQGGMGKIYSTRDIGLDRHVVLKVINPAVMGNTDLFTRFIEEARITGQLEHPNIVPVHDIGVLDNDQLYFSMKHIRGMELHDIIEGLYAQETEFIEKYTLFNLLTIFRKVCDATAFAHSNGVIHRDIKPDNILVGAFGEVLLVDWGLARREDQEELPSYETGFLDATGSASVTKTRDGIVKGTPAYMSPEQALGDVENVDRRSDIFLLGATLYALATLEAPYTIEDDEDIYVILERAEKSEYKKPSVRSPERQIPDELERIILKAMAAKQDDRYQTVEELSEDIDALIEGRSNSITVTFTPGEYLMKEGDEGDKAYAIVSGEVEVFKMNEDQRISLIRLGPGSTVGEMALIDNSLRSASVVAITTTEAVILTEELMQQHLAKLPPWMGQVVNSLADRLRSANTDIHPLLRGVCFYQVCCMLRYVAPFCAEIDEHEDSGQNFMCLDAERTILEVSVQLAIPAEKVLQVISRLLEAGLIVPVDEESFMFANYNFFCRFIEFMRDRMKHPSGVHRELNSFIHSDGLGLIVSFQKDETSALENVDLYELEISEIIAVDDPTEKDVENAFNDYLWFLQTGTLRNQSQA